MNRDSGWLRRHGETKAQYKKRRIEEMKELLKYASDELARLEGMKP